MSPEPRQLVLEAQLVCVVDTNCLINLKRLVVISEQWAMLLYMTSLVKAGQLAFPRQVAKELEGVQYPDAPGAWVSDAKHHVVHREPSEETLRRVLRIAQLVDPAATNTNEVADPYVAAMACELNDLPEYRVVVATDDEVDRMPAKESLKTACDRLGLERWTSGEFVNWIREGMSSHSA